VSAHLINFHLRVVYSDQPVGQVSRSNDITAQVGTEWSTKLFQRVDVRVFQEETFRSESRAYVRVVHEITRRVRITSVKIFLSFI
jgi:hypothetical protein